VFPKYRGDVTTYRHTQPGTLLLLCSVLAGLVGATLAFRAGQWPSAIAVIVLVVVIAFLFSSLTVEVGEGELRWYFGPGLWTYRVALTEIKDVGIVRNHWWNGWGIRMAPGFRLYNVSGLDAVELRVGPGDIRRIGTDDPQGLVQALKMQRAE
jgi:hypothetical protein